MEDYFFLNKINHYREDCLHNYHKLKLKVDFSNHNNNNLKDYFSIKANKSLYLIQIPLNLIQILHNNFQRWELLNITTLNNHKFTKINLFIIHKQLNINNKKVLLKFN